MLDDFEDLSNIYEAEPWDRSTRSRPQMADLRVQVLSLTARAPIYPSAIVRSISAGFVQTSDAEVAKVRGSGGQVIRGFFTRISLFFVRAKCAGAVENNKLLLLMVQRRRSLL